MPLVLTKVEEDSASIERRLLNVVLEVAGDREDLVRDGVIKALKDESDKARRTYLWGVLTKRAKEKIRRARRKFSAAA